MPSSPWKEMTNERRLVVCHQEQKNSEGRAAKCLKLCKEICEVAGDADELDILVPEKGLYEWRKALEIAFANKSTHVTICIRRPTEAQGDKTQGATRPTKTMHQGR